MKVTTQQVAIAIAVVLLVSTAAGAAYFFLAVPDDPREPETAADIERWCDDVAAGIGPGHPFPDVSSLIDAIERGRLQTPEAEPVDRSPAAVERWRAQNAEYLTSSYLRQLTTFSAPREVTLSWAVLQLAIENAHEGRPGYDAGELDGVADTLDGYLEHRC